MPSVTSSFTKPSNSAFKQQRLRACQPILTPVPVIWTFLIVGIIFLPLGVVFYHVSQQVREVTFRYDVTCGDQEICRIDLPPNIDMRPPIYFYYRMENFYQNHRTYVNSRNDAQLQGSVVTSYSSLSSCSPYASVGSSSDPNKFYLPCGLIAHSMFNDTFLLSNGTGFLPMRKKGIAWTSDATRFKNPPANAPGIRVIPDFEDEDFMVWMRTAGLPSFAKLYRIIDFPLKGNYTLEIYNNYPVSSFNGEKHVVISEVSWLGGKNSFLGIAYMSVGCVCIVLSIVFFFKHFFAGRKLGDITYLGWNRP